MYLKYLALTAFLSFVGADVDPLIDLPDGTIKGRAAKTFSGLPYLAFQGIPYAAPPVEELRFKPPVPPQKWEGILDTVSYDAICYQVDRNSRLETEDCLHVNVFTPQLNPEEGETTTYPVLIYIYGGGFVDGNCYDYLYGPDFLIENGVILVTLNYRVGPFGFLSTQDRVIPGNNGLWDQHLAIKWTHENIRLFGGNPDQITLSGHAAGAASVAYQFLNKNNEGLFRAAILESGSFLSPWSYQRDAREIAFVTGSILNETFEESEDSRALLEYLQSVDAEDLDDAAYILTEYESLDILQESQGFFWAPVVEPEHANAFFTEKMYVSLSKGNFIQVPTLIGFTSEESLFEAERIDILKYIAREFNRNPEWLVPLDMQIEDEELERTVGLLIKALYTQGDRLQDDPAYMVQYFSDTSFTRSIIRHAELQARYTDVYFYQFSYDGAIGDSDIVVEGCEKVENGEELRYIYRAHWEEYDTGDKSLFPEQDGITQDRLVKIWTDFVKYTNPTPEPSELLQNITWPKVTGEQPNGFSYVDIDADLTIRQNPKERTYSGWRALYNNLEFEDFDTY